MTWIVGAAAALGYAVGISDIRVTFSDGSEQDCLQKIYPIARFVAAGFAGSVRIGFTILSGLAYLMRDAPPDRAFFPQSVADCLSPLARDIFQSQSPEERALHSHLMLLGAHPTEDVGIPGYSRCSVHILKSPDFMPIATRIGEVVSIGSGSVYPSYRETLAEFSSNPMLLLQMERTGRGASTVWLRLAVHQTVVKNPVPGISPHAHICLVYRGTIDISPNDHDQHDGDGKQLEFRMPKVATTWEEFVQICADNRTNAEGAVC
jgi:hypothetical protein